jgi:pyruvate dehydrogenase E2 component (dihydrolipoamide acetyltransferase)
MPDVLMPRLSDTMTEGVLSEWRKGEGDQVHRGDVLAEIETDKATMELEAYDDGVLERHLVSPGTTVPIGQPIAVIGDGTGTAPVAVASPAAPAPAAQPAPRPGRRAPPRPPPPGSGRPARARRAGRRARPRCPAGARRSAGIRRDGGAHVPAGPGPGT